MFMFVPECPAELANCTKCNNASTCTECISGFHLSSGACTEGIKIFSPLSSLSLPIFLSPYLALSLFLSPSSSLTLHLLLSPLPSPLLPLFPSSSVPLPLPSPSFSSPFPLPLSFCPSFMLPLFPSPRLPLSL